MMEHPEIIRTKANERHVQMQAAAAQSRRTRAIVPEGRQMALLTILMGLLKRSSGTATQSGPALTKPAV